MILAERQARIEDNRRAVDEAAALGADALVLVCGPAPDKDIGAAREMVREGIAALLPYAEERGVRLGIEPLHPIFAGDRSVIVTLAEANALVEAFASPTLGIDAEKIEIVQGDPLGFEDDRRVALVRRVDQVLGDFGLAIDHHGLAAGQRLHVDPEGLAVHGQGEAVVNQALAAHPGVDAHLVEQIDGTQNPS